jgi:hypothetical protein
MSRDWPWTAAERLEEVVQDLQRNMSGFDVLPTLRTISVARDLIIEIAGEVVEIAAAETTLTQKVLAEALDVPPSTLRGLRS